MFEVKGRFHMQSNGEGNPHMRGALLEISLIRVYSDQRPKNLTNGKVQRFSHAAGCNSFLHSASV